MRSEFIFEHAPFVSAHASTIVDVGVDTGAALVAAWFGGTREGHRDVGIWLARHDGEAGGWSAPVEVANGVVGRWKRYPCWNPVLHHPSDGPLMLFYKVGPSPSRWWGMLTTSPDRGRTWSPPRRLPPGFLGPIKNKPVEMPDGGLLCPSSTEDAGWRVHLEHTADLGHTWSQSDPLNDGTVFAAIQPSILTYPSGRMQILCRTRQGVIAECRSDDGGYTWSEMMPTMLPNPDSGTDAVMLADGRAMLVYNHSNRHRSPLNVALSDDGGHWQAARVLEDSFGEFSYPAVIQSRDGLVHITYTWNRHRIKHVVLNPAELMPVDIQGGLWPEE